MNILPNGALQFIFIKNCFDFLRCNLWVGEDENKKEAGLSLQNKNDWLSAWSWKESVSLLLQQMSQKVAWFAVPFKSLLTPTSTTSFSVTESWSFQGKSLGAWCFSDLYVRPENIWWASGSESTSCSSPSVSDIFVPGHNIRVSLEDSGRPKNPPLTSPDFLRRSNHICHGRWGLKHKRMSIWGSC